MLTKGKSAKTRNVIEKLMNDLRDASERSDTSRERIELQNQINQLEKEVGATFKKHVRPIKTNNENDDVKAQEENFRKKDNETSTDEGVKKVPGGNSSKAPPINRGSSGLGKNNAKKQ